MLLARVRAALVAAVLFVGPLVSAGNAAQDPNAASSPAAVQEVAPAPQVTTSPETGATGLAGPTLPARAAPERTLRAYWHVFGAFALTWILLFGYVIALGRRFSRLERELEASRK